MMGLVKQFLSFVLTAASFQGLASAQLDFSQEDIVSGKALQSIGKTAYDNALARIGASAGTCTKDNVRVRKEWRNIPGEERTAFTNAVKCLMEDQPSVYTDLNSTGPRSMFDSFGVLHYLLTPYVHNSAYFLLFHRLYIWTYEEKLRTLCGYTGAFPYWEWGLDARSVEGSPLFDGSETSMGSNGAKVNSSSSPGGGGFGGFGGFGGGSGGGCVTEGPFVNYTVNFGPNTARDPLAYNPRCLKRNLNTAICASSASLQNTTGTILESPDIELFQGNVQGDFRYPESRKWGMAVHGGGHFAIAGDPGGDFYFSPLEPAFYLHHGQIDRMYFIWQNLDFENRQTMAGTITMMNQPPSRNGTLDDVLDITPVGEAYTYRELLDTVGGSPFCFVYE